MRFGVLCSGDVLMISSVSYRVDIPSRSRGLENFGCVTSVCSAAPIIDICGVIFRRVKVQVWKVKWIVAIISCWKERKMHHSVCVINNFCSDVGEPIVSSTEFLVRSTNSLRSDSLCCITEKLAQSPETFARIHLAGATVSSSRRVLGALVARLAK